MKNSVYLLVVLCCLCACQKPTQYRSLQLMSKPPLLDESILKPRPEIPVIEKVISLTDQQKNDFLKSYGNDDALPSLRVFNYMSNHLTKFNYYSDTLTASEALAESSGNCLSLAILTKSLADLAGIGIRYEMVRTPPVFQKSNEVLLSSQHIRAVLYNSPVEPGTLPSTVTKSITIDYYPSEGTDTLRWVDEKEFFSLFYTNKAAESLAYNNLDDAYWYLKEALKIKASNVQAINMMGIIYGRKGLFDGAEQWYLYGLNFGRDQFDLLKNYYALLKRMDRKQDAERIAQQLSQYDTNNPFDWIALGDDAYQDKHYKKAIKYYKKAAIMAKYLHEPYAGIARSQYMMGNKKSAYKAMKLALKNTHKGDVLAVYQAKYNLLNEELNLK